MKGGSKQSMNRSALLDNDAKYSDSVFTALTALFDTRVQIRLEVGASYTQSAHIKAPLASIDMVVQPVQAFHCAAKGRHLLTAIVKGLCCASACCSAYIACLLQPEIRQVQLLPSQLSHRAASGAL